MLLINQYHASKAKQKFQRLISREINQTKTSVRASYRIWKEKYFWPALFIANGLTVWQTKPLRVFFKCFKRLVLKSVKKLLMLTQIVKILQSKQANPDYGTYRRCI